jgi:hypothetical protein
MARVAQRQASTAAILAKLTTEVMGLKRGSGPFVEAHHRRALVLEYGLVGMHANQQLGAELAGLKHGTSMACTRDQASTSREIWSSHRDG